jgi:hypothetical protein
MNTLSEIQSIEHHCSCMPDSGISLFTEPRNLSQRESWIMSISRMATEQDLEENNHLECVGDIIWQTLIEVTHCPYCGISLYKDAKDIPDTFDEPIHVDLSNW